MAIGGRRILKASFIHQCWLAAAVPTLQFDQHQVSAPIESQLELAKPNEHCGRGDNNIEYVGTPIAHLPNISSPALCCIKCKETPQCRIWVWGKKRGFTQITDGGDLVCTLRSADSNPNNLKKVPNNGVVSGLSFDWAKHSSIFCFALMQPFGYERHLMETQFQRQWGIFGCDEYEVISNQSITLGQGLVTSVAISNLVCESGGEFGTALNTDIFLQVWRAVFDDGRYTYNDWTVKADPDCVFFPQRLRVLLAFHPDTYKGVYLNNCKYGMHGPIEILSRQAVQALPDGFSKCKKHFNKLCSGPCLWGEDMFLDQCLHKVLEVTRIDDWNILSEDHCDSDDWEECSSHRVAFHPFKSVKTFAKCIDDAGNGEIAILV